MALENTAESRIVPFARNQDIALAAAILGILVVLIIPVPSYVLDVLLTLNISFSVVVLLATLYLQKPTDFAVFPALLLILTLFRLSLNVATTRLILSQADGGSVINAFGSFVTAGNLFVGVVIFIILVVIQFVVITKGATRISEVAARFTLDAMPGKQMGIDAELNAGLISETAARTRRREIEREADFYGAMDGATKFVRGDAIAGIIITIVNIVVGLVVGMVMMNLSFADAAAVYTRLTVGDGLVSQIPSLVVSTAAGLVVTRAVSEDNLGSDLSRQLTRYPRALGVAAFMLAAFGLVPGMPTLPFLFVAALLTLATYSATKTQGRVEEELRLDEMRQEEEDRPATPAERTEDLLNIDPLKVELGYGLISMADPQQGGDLLSRIQIIRQQIATKMGFIVPVIRIVDNMRLRPNEYCIKLRESTLAAYEVMPGHYLAMNPGLVEDEIEGYPTKEPAFGLQAVWVSEDNRDRAERMGYTLVEPTAVLATHLTEIIMGHADELVTREDVQTLINHLKETSPTVIGELVPSQLTVGEVQKVLHALLRERVSIRNLETIMEVLSDYAPRTKDTEILAEYCRHALAREITSVYADDENALHVVTLSPEVEREVLDAVQRSEGGEYIPVPPQRADELSESAARAVQPLMLAGQEPVILTTAPVRRYFRRIVERRIPKVVVLSYNEVDPAVKLESTGQIEG